MATISWLNVNLALGSAQFTKGIAKVRGEASSLVGTLGSLKGVAAGALGAIGLGVGVGAFAGFVKGSLDAIDSANDVAQRIGVTTEALTSLRFAAKLSGVEAGQFDAALGKMTVTLGKAAMGASGPADALKRIGLDAQQVANLAPEQAFLRIAEGISKIENPAERAATTVELFGKSGQALVPLLAQGSAGIAELQAEAVAMGAAISSVDAQQVAAANDALDLMGIAIKGVGNTLAIQLAPFIEAAATRFVTLSMEGNRFGSIVTAAFEGSVKAVAFFADGLNVISTAFRWVQIKVTQSIKFIIDQLMNLLDLLHQTFGELAFPSGQGGFLQAFSEDLGRTIDDLQGQFDQKFLGPTSGEKITAFFDDIRKRAKEAAEIAVAAQPKFGELSPEALAKAAEKDKPAKAAKLELAGAAERGSSEALSAINRAIFGGKNREQTQIAANTKKAADENQKQTGLLRQMVDRLPEIKVAAL